MGDVSENFSRSEFRCQCGQPGCHFDTVDIELVSVLQRVRDHFNRKVTITSGCRCPQHNANVGGAIGNPQLGETPSRHTYGQAADFKVHGVSPAKVYQYLNAEYPHAYGIGLYKSWVHCDVRREKARWTS